MSKTDRIARRRPPSDRLYVSVSFIILPDRYTASLSLRLFIQPPIHSTRVYSFACTLRFVAVSIIVIMYIINNINSLRKRNNGAHIITDGYTRARDIFGIVAGNGLLPRIGRMKVRQDRSSARTMYCLRANVRV